MSDRYSYAEAYYKNLLSGQFGLQEVVCASVAKVNKINKRPAFSFYLDQVKFDRVLINTNNKVVTIKTLKWIGVLWVTDGGLALDDARLTAYPLIRDIASLIDGSLVDYASDPDLKTEMVEPAYTTDEGPIEVQTGQYAWMIAWDFGMQFTQGVNV